MTEFPNKSTQFQAGAKQVEIVQKGGKFNQPAYFQEFLSAVEH